MRELIVKLETLKESKEREKAVEKLRDWQKEKNQKLLEWITDPNYDTKYYSEWDMIRHEIKFISELIGGLKIKDKETREALVEDLNKSMNWRINRLLWKTHEYKLDDIHYDDAYTEEDL